jgi:L-lactate dehydrogenase complex protein LldF
MGIKIGDSNLKQRMNRALSDSFMRAAIAGAQDLINRKRRERYCELGDFEKWRDLASGIRAHVLENLDYYLDQFSTAAQKAGASVYFAGDSREAVDIAAAIFRRKNAKKAVKSKSMVTEEIGLNEALEEIGVEILETDLGEYLLQVDDCDKPSHIVIPVLHKDRRSIRRLLAERLGYGGDDTPETMTRFVRGILRKAFLSADVAVTGCNFGVADTGTVALMTNEGNGRFVTSAPKTHVVFMGMERLVPSFRELDILFSMLARSAVGARSSVYMSLLTGPRGAGDVDGPEDLSVIVVDNGRSKVLAGAFRDVLSCIRCGACMLECPVYRHIGGHAYGALYPGPLGAALVPVMAGYAEHKDMTQLCTLCGACNDVCPVKIPLVESVREHRRIIAEEKRLSGACDRAAFAQYGRVIGSPALYRAATRLAPLANASPRTGPFGRWTGAREMPRFPRKRFRDLYEENRAEGKKR